MASNLNHLQLFNRLFSARIANAIAMMILFRCEIQLLSWAAELLQRWFYQWTAIESMANWLRISLKFASNVLWICFEFALNLIWIYFKKTLNSLGAGFKTSNLFRICLKSASIFLRFASHFDFKIRFKFDLNLMHLIFANFRVGIKSQMKRYSVERLRFYIVEHRSYIDSYHVIIESYWMSSLLFRLAKIDALKAVYWRIHFMSSLKVWSSEFMIDMIMTLWDIKLSIWNYRFYFVRFKLQNENTILFHPNFKTKSFFAALPTTKQTFHFCRKKICSIDSFIFACWMAPKNFVRRQTKCRLSPNEIRIQGRKINSH